MALRVRFYSYFLAVLCKTTTRNDKVLSILENVNDSGLFFVISFRIERWHYRLNLTGPETHRRTEQI